VFAYVLRLPSGRYVGKYSCGAIDWKEACQWETWDDLCFAKKMGIDGSAEYWDLETLEQIWLPFDA